MLLAFLAQSRYIFGRAVPLVDDASGVRVGTLLAEAEVREVTGGMIPVEDEEDGKNKAGFEDIEVPFVCDEIAIAALRELDETVDATNLVFQRLDLS